MDTHASVRLVAARIITKVSNGDSLNTVLPPAQEKIITRDRPLLAELCYGTLRYYYRLDAWTKYLTNKPLKERDIYHLILLGLYQLFYTRIPPHAAVGETVQASKYLGKTWAQRLINGVLRNAQRKISELQKLQKSSLVSSYAHPKWLIKTIKKAWPNHYQQILEQNNQPPPMTLRINQNKIQKDYYLKTLLAKHPDSRRSKIAEQAITLGKAIDIDEVPFFSDGVVSIQDESAQLAANLIQPHAGDHILDACSAPGGKACHLLELNSQITLDALDIDQTRLEKIKQNLTRLNLSANIIQGDATKPENWYKGKLYDYILLDVPCSSTGVIRRHPDIKLLRKPADIEHLSYIQRNILQSIWPLLRTGGTLLYATCSILPVENHEQIERFLKETTNATLLPIQAEWGHDTGFGRQLLPDTGDGFFYCLLTKSA